MKSFPTNLKNQHHYYSNLVWGTVFGFASFVYCKILQLQISLLQLASRICNCKIASSFCAFVMDPWCRPSHSWFESLITKNLQNTNWSCKKEMRIQQLQFYNCRLYLTNAKVQASGYGLWTENSAPMEPHGKKIPITPFSKAQRLLFHYFSTLSFSHVLAVMPHCDGCQG